MTEQRTGMFHGLRPKARPRPVAAFLLTVVVTAICAAGITVGIDRNAANNADQDAFVRVVQMSSDELKVRPAVELINLREQVAGYASRHKDLWSSTESAEFRIDNAINAKAGH